MKMRICIAVFIVCLIIPSLSWSKQLRVDKKKEVESWNQQRHFYGRVVDMDGDPLKDVEVSITLRSLSSYESSKHEKIKLRTNKDGEFKVDFNGYMIIVSSVQKEFYEYSRYVNRQSSISYISNKHLETSKDKPLVFRLRKRLVPALLIHKSADDTRIFFRWDKAKLEGFELLWEYYDENGFEQNVSKMSPAELELQRILKSMKSNKKHEFNNKQNDVRVEGKPLADDAGYEITFQMSEEGAGVILSDQLLYESPADGYETSMQIIVNKNMIESGTPEKEYSKYLYIKGDGGKYYSRVNVSVIVNPEHIGLYLIRYTNPAGSRNLEYDEKYQYEELGRRIKINRKRFKANLELKERCRVARVESQKKGIKFDEKKFNEENKFDEEKFMEKIRAEEVEADMNKPLKWWDKLKKEKDSKGK